MRTVLRLLFVSFFLARFSLAQDVLLPNRETPEDGSRPSVFFKNPEPGIWMGPEKPSEKTLLNQSQTEEKIQALTEIGYLELQDAPPEIFQFRAAHETQYLQVFLGRTAHNLLLRKALLQKLGFVVPPMVHVPKLKVTFPEKRDRKTFLSKLEQRTSSDIQRWVIDDGKISLILQDVVVSLEDPSLPMNLAEGDLSEKEIRNYPILSTLILPYVLTDLTESINLFPWSSGRIYSQGVKVNYRGAEKYRPTYVDLREMLKTMSTLNREDWAEIACSAGVPKPVELLLTEKLIARRNSLMELFRIESAPLSFDSTMTFYPDLIKGQITREEWEGYATRFTSGSPESPFNDGEIFAYNLSGVMSTAINAAVSLMNQQLVFQKDPESLLDSKIAKSLLSGKLHSHTLGVWSYPLISGELIFSRAILTGPYFGTDHLFQLADQFGFKVNLGAQIQLDQIGLPAGVGISGQVSFSRTYAHLKPIKSIRKANRYGFQNAIVPYLMRKSANQLTPLFADGFEQLPFETKKSIYQSVLEDFQQMLPPGESLIVTDSLVPETRASVSFSPYKLIRLGTEGAVSRFLLNRLHIYRKDETTFQIYKDFGEATQPSITLEIGIQNPIPKVLNLNLVPKQDQLQTATFPVIRIKAGKNNGHTETRFYPVHLSIHPGSEDELSDSMGQLEILRQTLLKANTETLKKHVQPYRIENDFSENNLQARFLLFSHQNLKSDSTLTITTPEGVRKTFTRDFYGWNKALDYYNTANNTLDYAIQMAVRTRVDFGYDVSINPGYTTNGYAKNKLLVYEAETRSGEPSTDRYVKFSHIHNGWRLSRKQIQKILDQYSREYGEILFPKTVLNETEEIFLYNVSINIHLYENAIRHLESLTEEKVRNLFSKYGMNLEHRRVDDRIINRLREFFKTRSAKSLMRAISIADHYLPADGFLEFLGGKENLFLTAQLDGFRKGDENVNAPILSNTIGIAGGSRAEGPLTEFRKKLGMTEGEFYSFWILGRFI